MREHIVLVQPEIPQNTGNISRLCVGLNAVLHLIRPLGFSLDSKYTKRAGLDYWDKLALHVHDDTQAFFRYIASMDTINAHYALSSKANRIYFNEQLVTKEIENCFLYFGSETRGLNEHFHAHFADINGIYLTIPMHSDCRCLNLSNSVAIVAYEVLRQYNAL